MKPDQQADNEYTTFWTASVSLVFVRADQPDQPLKDDINALHITREPYLSKADLEAIQVHAQKQLHAKTTGVEVQVLDLHLNAVSNLGRMTKKQFFGPAKDPNAPAPSTQQ
ncbi:hypothetical protein D3C76_27690 [compost metagenome]